jgi:hypothetical protein
MKPLTHMTDHELALAVDGGHRAALIQGLHDAAAFLTAHPGIPVPSGVTIQYSAHGHGEVDRAAAAAGTEASEHGGFYGTQRHFGPAVDYKAVAISSDVMAAWDEAMRAFDGAQSDTAAAA